MARRKVDFGDTVDIKEVAGKEAEGTYLGHKEVDTNLGTSMLYKFERKNGEPFSIWGFTSLDIYMENVMVGTYCWITYKGLSEKKNKYGKHTHMCMVEVDDDTSCVPTKKDEKLMAPEEVNDKFGIQDVNEPEEFMEAMLYFKTILKKATGDNNFYGQQLKDKFSISFLAETKGDAVLQDGLIKHFRSLCAETRQEVE